MRLIKLFGLTAITAVAAMAFLGASSATAGNTLLCLNNTASLTPTAGECNAPTSVHYTSVGKNTLLTEDGNVQCEALIQGTATNILETAVFVKITEYSFFNCTGTCTVKALEVPGLQRKATLLILKTAANLASFIFDELAIFMKCFFGLIECEYTGTGLTGHGLGATATSQDHLTYTEAPLSNNGKYANCPETAKLDALFTSLANEGKIYIRS